MKMCAHVPVSRLPPMHGRHACTGIGPRAETIEQEGVLCWWQESQYLGPSNSPSASLIASFSFATQQRARLSPHPSSTSLCITAARSLMEDNLSVEDKSNRLYIIHSLHHRHRRPHNGHMAKPTRSPILPKDERSLIIWQYVLVSGWVLLILEVLLCQPEGYFRPGGIRPGGMKGIPAAKGVIQPQGG